MVRRYADPVEVRPAAGAGPADDTPSTFLWRGRLYVVREVLGHWRERRAWWTAAAARAVHGEGGGADEWGGADEGGGADERGGTAPGGAGGRGTGGSLDQEREVWRVEASAGRSFGSGVFDLCRELSTSPSGAVDGAWRLLRVAD
jgi:hypothetical protein